MQFTAHSSEPLFRACRDQELRDDRDHRRCFRFSHYQHFFGPRVRRLSYALTGRCFSVEPFPIPAELWLSSPKSSNPPQKAPLPPKAGLSLFRRDAGLLDPRPNLPTNRWLRNPFRASASPSRDQRHAVSKPVFLEREIVRPDHPAPARRQLPTRRGRPRTSW